MLQRIQTVFLLVAIVCLATTFGGGFFSFAKSVSNNNASDIIYYATGGTEPSLLFTSLVSILLGGVSIGLFKNRSLQITFVGVSFLFALAWIGVAIYRTRILAAADASRTVVFGAGLVFAAIALLLLLLAIRAIRKDEKLVRSADRLR